VRTEELYVDRNTVSVLVQVLDGRGAPFRDTATLVVSKGGSSERAQCSTSSTTGTRRARLYEHGSAVFMS
jgi:hypothetical protein